LPSRKQGPAPDQAILSNTLLAIDFEYGIFADHPYGQFFIFEKF
jgi:hypothetical protein